MIEAPIDSTHGFNVYCKFDTYLSIEELEARRHPKNRNKHSKKGVERLAKAMSTPNIGVRHPIVISTRSDTIITGHKRLLSAIKAGFTHFPVSYQTFIDEESEYIHLQADNAHGQDSELEFSSIHEDLASLQAFDTDLLGFDFQFEPKEKLKKAKQCPHCGEQI